ncbi:MAG: hypothetical protein AAFY98_08500 [Verrucomicrobiota bacterium]
MRWQQMVIAFFFVVGCSTPQKRAEERPEAFANLSKSDQSLVLSGQIKEGLNTDAVYVALGRPSRVLRGREKGVSYERWVYSTIVSYPVRARGTYFLGPHGPFPYCYYSTRWESYVIDTFEVQFEGGSVTGWREL